MENPNTWQLIHHDLARVACSTFSSTEQKAEALVTVLESHKLTATQEEVVTVLNNYAKGIEERRCGLSLMATLVNTFQK